MVITVGNKVHKGVYELNSDKDPKEIDIKPDASNLEDKHMYGIYALDADGQGLLLCLSEKKRPKKFETRPDPAGCGSSYAGNRKCELTTEARRHRDRRKADWILISLFLCASVVRRIVAVSHFFGCHTITGT